MMIQLKKFLSDTSGATAVEYGLIAGLIAIALMAGATQLGSSLDDKFGDTASTLDAAQDAIPTDLGQGGGD